MFLQIFQKTSILKLKQWICICRNYKMESMISWKCLFNHQLNKLLKNILKNFLYDVFLKCFFGHFMVSPVMVLGRNSITHLLKKSKLWTKLNKWKNSVIKITVAHKLRIASLYWNLHQIKHFLRKGYFNYKAYVVTWLIAACEVAKINWIWFLFWMKWQKFFLRRVIQFIKRYVFHH